jgi:hypothetical protein
LLAAWPVLILLALAFIIALGWLRDRLLATVDLPLIALLVIGTLALYPLLKLLEWIFLRKEPQPIELGGLSWKPSRWSFRYPTPICPRCKCEVHYHEKLAPQLVDSLVGIRRALDNPVEHVYECPNCHRLPIDNRPIHDLQKLARAKLRGSKCGS